MKQASTLFTCNKAFLILARSNQDINKREQATEFVNIGITPSKSGNTFEITGRNAKILPRTSANE